MFILAFKHKLKRLREENDLSMDELVSELHKRYGLTINKSTVSRWENGAEPKGKDLHYLAHFFKVPPSELIDLELSDTELKSLDDPKIPLFGTIAAGALAVVDGVTPDDVEHIKIPRKFLGRYSNCSKLFAMVVNGDSMNKTINHGSIVIAKPLELDQYKDGDIVIFSYNNEYSLKRFAPNDMDGFLLFKSESTDSTFKDIPIPINTSTEDLKIYGKVVYYGNTL